MKLKYYLRGLGIGIIVTAVIMGVSSGSGKETLSDREIMERAAELGMVEQGGSLADMEATAPKETEAALLTEPTEKPAETPETTKEPTAEPTETLKAAAESTAASEQAETSKGIKPTATPKAVAEPSVTPKASADPTATPKASKEPEAEPETAGKPAATAKASAALSQEAVTIEIKSGDSSYTICQKLEAEGLITSASEYDSYLYKNGYDRKLRIGSYEIPVNAKQDEIAKILTGAQ